MITIENLFREFLNLSYKIIPDIINIQTGDVYIKDLVILRKTKISWDFIMLASGEMISIPYIIIDIFKSFDVYHKGRVFELKPSSGLDTFIQLMLSLVHCIESKKYDTTLDGLKLLQEIGIKDFIDYLEYVYRINLSIPGVMCVSKTNLTRYI